MKHLRLALLLFVLFGLLPQDAALAGRTIEQILNNPRPDALLLDETSTLYESDRDQLLETLNRFADAKHIHFQVIIVASLDGMDVESTCNSIFDNWKLNQADVNGGMLLVFSVVDRQIFFDSRKPDDEKLLNEDEVRELISSTSVPLFRRYLFTQGIFSAVHGLMKLAGFDPIIKPEPMSPPVRESAPKRVRVEENPGGRDWIPAALALVVGITGAGLWRMLKNPSVPTYDTVKTTWRCNVLGSGSAGGLGAGGKSW